MISETDIAFPPDNYQGLAPKKKQWNVAEKLAFRIFGSYLFLLCIPMEKEFYDALSNFKLHYLTLQSFSAFYPPKFIVIDTIDGTWGILSYINLILVFAVSVLIGVVWTLLDHKATEYNKLQYWIWVIARYRLAYAMGSWGAKKIFLQQMVLPTVGTLNTAFGDLAEKKLYWQHVGIQPAYEVFLGFAEFVPALLLLHRRTVFLGALIAGVVCLNICIANHVYDGGVAVPAAYYAIIGFILASKEIPNIWKLFVKRQDVVPEIYYPEFTTAWEHHLRLGLKIVFNFIFIVLAPFLWGYGWHSERDNYNIPNTAGLPNIRGYYHVTEFRCNNKMITYSPLDTLRWHDAAFEKWSSMSYTTNRAAFVDRMKSFTPNEQTRDLAVTRFELGGLAGSRRYFYYEADTLAHLLKLQNKNPNYQKERMVLSYYRPSTDRVILRGLNEFHDSIYVVLDRAQRKYQLKNSQE